MVSNANQTTLDSPVDQWVGADIPWPNKIGASTPYDFEAHNLTAYFYSAPVAWFYSALDTKLRRKMEMWFFMPAHARRYFFG